MNLHELSVEAHAYAVGQGFWPEGVNLGEKVALIHSEASELLEALRYRPGDEDDAKYKQAMIEEELADIIIRVADLARYLDVADLDYAVRMKMSANRARPHKHGKEF